MPSFSGDHGPIHFAQTEHDEDLFKKIWDDPENEERIVIDIDDWKNCPALWERRFNKDGTRKQ